MSGGAVWTGRCLNVLIGRFDDSVPGVYVAAAALPAASSDPLVRRHLLFSLTKHRATIYNQNIMLRQQPAEEPAACLPAGGDEEPPRGRRWSWGTSGGDAGMSLSGLVRVWRVNGRSSPPTVRPGHKTVEATQLRYFFASTVVSIQLSWACTERVLKIPKSLKSQTL